MGARAVEHEADAAEGPAALDESGERLAAGGAERERACAGTAVDQAAITAGGVVGQRADLLVGAVQIERRAGGDGHVGRDGQHVAAACPDNAGKDEGSAPIVGAELIPGAAGARVPDGVVADAEAAVGPRIRPDKAPSLAKPKIEGVRTGSQHVGCGNVLIPIGVADDRDAVDRQVAVVVEVLAEGVSNIGALSCCR